MDLAHVVSVKHCGTTFLEWTVKHFSDYQVKSYHYNQYVAHQWREHTGGLVLSPIRHPLRVYKTWYSRNRFGEDFFTEWENFNYHWVAGEIDHVQPIDTLDRDEHLKRMGEILGCQIVSDWTPIGSGPDIKPSTYPDLGRVMALDVVKHFYGDSNGNVTHE